MREEERTERVHSISLMKENKKMLQEKKRELRELSKNRDVKRYLELMEEEVQSAKVLKDDDIRRKALTLEKSKCSHDIWFCMGGYRMDLDFGPESRDTYYRVANDEKTEFYLYRCLECWEEIQVPKDEQEEFFEENIVVRLPGNLILNDDYLEWQRRYHRLLLTNSTDVACQKLLKKLK